MHIQNAYFEIEIDERSGALTSLMVKANQTQLVSEPRLSSSFRLCLPLPGYQCNYAEGAQQMPASISGGERQITVRYDHVVTAKGSYPVQIETSVAIYEDEVRFNARVTNLSEYPLSEVWFPRIGGLTRFGATRDPRLAVPGYTRCNDQISLFREYPGSRNLGAEAAEYSTDYPGWGSMMMPWWDLYDPQADLGLYLGYHNPLLRYTTWHTYLYPMQTGRADAWMTPEHAAGDPVGLVFSHVHYPFIRAGETLETGDFILRVHPGDWHTGSLYYRDWFLRHFPFDHSASWLRQKSAWFSSSCLQPEDGVVNDYPGYGDWCQDAKTFGIDTYELIGWDKSGWERDYPEYYASPELGGRPAFRELMARITQTGGSVLAFVNYNILDQNSDWYRQELHAYTHQDQFGKTPNWMCWGQSTLLARKGLDVRRHVLASVLPRVEEILTGYFVDLARDGARGLQIDKVCVGSALDFNPLNTLKPDIALCEGLVQSMARMLAACRAARPDFAIASEAAHDRLMPYIDVFYRCSMGFDISPLRYVFPEWTSVQHVSGTADFNGINGALLTGSVICVEPHFFQGSLAHPHYRKLAEYLQEVERIRRELADTIFLGKYYDTLGAEIQPVTRAGDGSPSKALVYRVHGNPRTQQRALLVANSGAERARYAWKFTYAPVENALLYRPFKDPVQVAAGQELELDPEELHILLALYPAP